MLLKERSIALYFIVALVPANGLLIPIGRNWTPLQIAVIVLIGLQFIGLILSRGNPRNAYVPKIIMCFFALIIFISFNSYVFLPSKNEIKYISGEFPIREYGKSSLLYFLWTIFNLVMVLSLYFEIDSRPKFNQVIKVLLYSSVFYAVYALYQYIITSVLGDSSMGLVYILKPEYLYGPEAIRSASLEREPLYYSFYLMGVLFLSFRLYELKQFDQIPRKILILVISINLLAFFLTKATSGFVGLIVGFVIYKNSLFRFKRVLRPSILLRNIFIFIVVIFGLSVFVFINKAMLFRRLQTVISFDEGYVRIKSYIEGFEAFSAHPWIGIGIGNSPYFVSTEVIHNMYLSIATEMGIPFLLVFLAFLIYLIVNLYKRKNTGIFEYAFLAYLISTSVQWISFFNMNLPSFWFFCTLIVCLLFKRELNSVKTDLENIRLE
ncbi:O-antigen ligase family protein [Marinoscillum pacificum]|uniref:O-antigen ligase family protein n=1 Tax=Marinoscillum pacificum TaxID=392723 RepID=UPI0021583BCD|nr:O-antigen ligase family protein [Marinoscillum pacificum]